MQLYRALEHTCMYMSIYCIYGLYAQQNGDSVPYNTYTFEFGYVSSMQDCIEGSHATEGEQSGAEQKV